MPSASPNSEARILTIANAIVEDLNAEIACKDASGSSIGAQFTAALSFVGEYLLPSLKVLTVDVRFENMEYQEGSRGAELVELYPIFLSVQKECSAYDTDQLQNLTNLAVRIARRYKTTLCPCQGPDAEDYPKMVDALGGAALQVVSNDFQIYDPVCLRDYGHFHSRINLVLTEFTTR